MSDSPPLLPPPAAGRRSWADLGPRLASAVVLVPAAIVAVWLGGYFLAFVVGAVLAGAYREWDAMVTLRPLGVFGALLVALVFFGAMLFPAWGAWATLGLAAIAAIAALIRGGEGASWRAGGLVYFAVIVIALLAIRGTATAGIWAGMLLGSVVWLTDTGAFFAGRQFGGQKLAPGISPAKTWSGAVGGLLLGTLVGSVEWHFMTPSALWIGVLLCAATSILGQVGDLAESALKRRFRIKDSGDIIPGHGGLMDRLDSITFGALFFLLVGVLHGSFGAVAQGLLNW